MFVNRGPCSIVAANRVLIHWLLGVALVGENHRFRREIAGPALDRLADFELEFLRGQSEFGGDGGQSDISVKARQQTGATGSRFEHIGNRRKIVTHGLSNSRTALARRWTNGDNLNHSG